jgi:hypothetical protein
MSDPYGFKALIDGFLNEESAKYKAELDAGVDAEREEEIRAWFAFQEARRRFQAACLKREKMEGGNSALRDLPRPDFLN